MSDLSYSYVFLQSNLLELPIYFLCYHYLFQLQARNKEFFLLVTLSNLITHPVVFFVIMPLDLSYLHNILMAESFAVLAEALLHRWLFRVSFWKAFTAALLANLFSWQVAPGLTYFLFY